MFRGSQYAMKQRAAAVPPSTGPGGMEGALSRKDPTTAASTYLNRNLLSQEEERQGRMQDRQGAYDRALDDPTGTANLFRSYFDEAARGIAAPAMRDFGNTLAGVQGNTAARFGGNASSLEQKNVYNTSDLFSRNLSDALARLAPQAAGMGLNYTNMLGGAAGEASSERDRLTQLILSGIGQYAQPQKRGGNLLGALAGGVGGFLAGGPGGAAAGAYQGYGR